MAEGEAVGVPVVGRRRSTTRAAWEFLIDKLRGGIHAPLRVPDPDLSYREGWRSYHRSPRDAEAGPHGPSLRA
jgi:hypothetical protein